MDCLNSKIVSTQDGDKIISVHACNIIDLDETVDVMTVSAFFRNYTPTAGTMYEALKQKGIDVEELAKDPAIDLREPCNIWLSREMSGQGLPIGRMGCIEMSPYKKDLSGWRDREGAILATISAYFRMLDIASVMGMKVETIGLPILGGGNQKISSDLIITPLLNECIRFLKTNRSVRRIMVITKNQQQAFHFAMALEKSYAVQAETAAPAADTALSSRSPLSERRPAAPGPEEGAKKVQMAFISYSSKDKNVADNLCAKLEGRGIKVWYAPRNIHSTDYASAIVEAITQCDIFIVILSRSSAMSNHVLNEIDLAFRELSRGIKIVPLKIDEEEMGPAFLYYLSRQHWMDAVAPPLEKRLEEFADSLIGGKIDDFRR